jgi:hypothetical protein
MRDFAVPAMLALTLDRVVVLGSVRLGGRGRIPVPIQYNVRYREGLELSLTLLKEPGRSPYRDCLIRRWWLRETGLTPPRTAPPGSHFARIS